MRAGETLRLTRDQEAGDPGRRAIPCTLDDVFGAARPGDPIWFDDAKAGRYVRLDADLSRAIRSGKIRL